MSNPNRILLHRQHIISTTCVGSTFSKRCDDEDVSQIIVHTSYSMIKSGKFPKHTILNSSLVCNRVSRQFLSSKPLNVVSKALPVARLASAYNPCTVAYSSVVFFLYAFTFQIKRSNRHPNVRRPSCGPGRLRSGRPQMIGWRGKGVSDDAFEGSFRAGKSVVVAGLNRAVARRCLGPVATSCAARLEVSEHFIRLKSNFS